jgi:hypothetical protein
VASRSTTRCSSMSTRSLLLSLFPVRIYSANQPLKIRRLFSCPNKHFLAKATASIPVDSAGRRREWARSRAPEAECQTATCFEISGLLLCSTFML